MAGDIQKVPQEVSKAGLGFSFASWNANTEVVLTTVPWDGMYRDVVKFASRSALHSYLAGRPGAIKRSGLSRANLMMPVRLTIPFEDAMKFNYVHTHNPEYARAGKTSDYYYFITSVDWISTDTTQITLELDVFQTFGDQVKFGNCFIQQGHIGVANNRQGADNGREFLSIPEGLDMGSEYIIRDRQTSVIAQVDNLANRPAVIITSTAHLEGEMGDYGSTKDPKIETSHGSSFEALPNGAAHYYFDSTDRFLSAMSRLSVYSWVSQNITSVMLVPQLGRFSPGAPLGENVKIAGIDAINLSARLYPVELIFNKLEGREWAGERYKKLRKFNMSPYTMLELTMYNSNPLMLKPESWEVQPDGKLKVMLLLHLAMPSPRLMVYPYRYNAGQVPPTFGVNNGGQNYVRNDGGEYLDMSTGMYNFPTFSVVNNAATIALANQAHRIQFQFNNADWAYQKANQAADTTYDQATSGINLSKALTQNESTRLRGSYESQYQSMSDNAHIGLANSGVNVAGSALTGNYVGAAGSAAHAAIGVTLGLEAQQNALSRQNGIAMTALNANNNASVENARFMQGTNRQLAEFANKGDYQNAIASINAQVQDLALTPPSVAGQSGGDAFNLAVDAWRIDLKLKTIQGGPARSIGEYWLRYGYKVNQYGVPPESLMVMSKFTYWKLSETYLSSATCPETFKKTIRGIFEKGVTVWAKPDYIGRIDMAENEPLEGISL